MRRRNTANLYSGGADGVKAAHKISGLQVGELVLAGGNFLCGPERGPVAESEGDVLGRPRGERHAWALVNVKRHVSQESNRKREGQFRSSGFRLSTLNLSQFHRRQITGSHWIF